MALTDTGTASWTPADWGLGCPPPAGGGGRPGLRVLMLTLSLCAQGQARVTVMVASATGIGAPEPLGSARPPGGQSHSCDGPSPGLQGRGLLPATAAGGPGRLWACAVARVGRLLFGIMKSTIIWILTRQDRD